jgi:hypothetical protein
VGNHKKTQEGVFIALFALSTLVVLGLAIGFMSNTVNDLLAGQGQVMAGKQSYWLAYSGMEITSTNRFAEITAGTNTYTLEGGKIKTVGTISADKFNGSDRTNEFTSTGTVADGSRQSRWTLGNPTNYALVFDGNNDLVSHSMDLATSASASVSTWFMKKGGDGAIQHLVMFNDADDPSGTYGTHLLVGTDNKLFFSIQDYSETQNPSIKSSSTYIVNSLWYHVVTTWNKSSYSAADFKIYVNGVDVTDGGSFSLGSYDTDFALNIDEGTIGADSRTGVPAEFFNGIIDEVSIWSIALSIAQIQSLFIQGRNFSVTNIESGSLAGYWNFQNSFNDASGNSNHGTNTGATFTGI